VPVLRGVAYEDGLYPLREKDLGVTCYTGNPAAYNPITLTEGAYKAPFAIPTRRTPMTIDTLFGPEEVTTKPRSIKFKQIRAVYETLTVKETTTNYLKPNTRYTSASQVQDTFSFLRNETKEYFIVAHLDGKNRIVAIDLSSIGSLNQSIVHPREIYKTALLSSAAAIICIHNHPTGDPSPSGEDLEVTRRLKEAGQLLGVKLLDHIIIGDYYYSFAENGHL
jgi:DNA repair protein RadC